MVKPTMLNNVQDVEACLSDVFTHEERVHALNMFAEAKKVCKQRIESVCKISGMHVVQWVFAAHKLK